MLKRQLKEMLMLQDNLNSIINPNWKKEGYAYLRAAVVECAELMDALNYKWWKKQEPNLYQAQLELVDKFHFMLSAEMVLDKQGEQIIEAVLDNNKYYIQYSTLELVEQLMLLLLKESSGEEKINYWPCYFELCNRLNLSFNSLYKMYIGKNVLNQFRQDKGYKKGTYIKTWSKGLEDNNYLEAILNDLEKEQENLFDIIYNRLDIYYKEVEKNATVLLSK